MKKIKLSSYSSHYLFNFVDSMLYNKDILSLEDAKLALHSNELRQKVSVVESEDQVKGLFVHGRT